ncbi:MAG: 6-pyruvoyl trahydropterin synthase family protein [Bacteroidales bacterium]
MLYLTRRERFSAAHRMFNPDWTDEENLKVFGKCANPNWHGHNYILYVTVKGDISEESGLVVNMNTLKEIIREKIINKVNHCNLNLEVDFMKGLNATTENLAVAIWNEIEEPVRKTGGELYCIKIEETENNTVEYYGKKNQNPGKRN